MSNNHRLMATQAAALTMIGVTAQIILKMKASNSRSFLAYYFSKMSCVQSQSVIEVLSLQNTSDHNNIAAKIVSMSTSGILAASNKCHLLTDDDFWKMLFMKSNLEIFVQLCQVDITKGLKQFYRDYSPVSYTLVDEKKVYKYNFWEPLYVECEQMLSCEGVCEALESLMNNQYEAPKFANGVINTMLEYPFVSLFLGMRYSTFRKEIVGANSNLYEYLPLHKDPLYKYTIIDEFVSGSPVVIKKIMESSYKISLRTMMRTLEVAIKNSCTEAILLLVDEKVSNRIQPVGRFDFEGDIPIALCLASEEVLELMIEKGWVDINKFNQSQKVILLGNVLVNGMVSVYRRIDFDSMDIPQGMLHRHVLAAIKSKNEEMARGILFRTDPKSLDTEVIESLIVARLNSVLTDVIKLNPIVTIEISTEMLLDFYREGMKKEVFTVIENGLLTQDVKMLLYDWALQEEEELILNILRVFRTQDPSSSNYSALIIAYREGKHEQMIKMFCSMNERQWLLALVRFVEEERYRLVISILNSIDMNNIDYGDLESQRYRQSLEDVIVARNAVDVLDAYLQAHSEYNTSELLVRLYSEDSFECMKVVLRQENVISDTTIRLLEKASYKGRLDGVCALLHSPAVMESENQRREEILKSIGRESSYSVQSYIQYFRFPQSVSDADTSIYKLNEDQLRLLSALKKRDMNVLMSTLAIPDLDLSSMRYEMLSAALKWDLAVYISLIFDPRLNIEELDHFRAFYCLKERKWREFQKILYKRPTTALSSIIELLIKEKDIDRLLIAIPYIKGSLFSKNIDFVDVEILNLFFNNRSYYNVLEELSDLLAYVSDNIVNNPEVSICILDNVSTMSLHQESVSLAVANCVVSSLRKLDDWSVSDCLILKIIERCNLPNVLDMALKRGVNPGSCYSLILTMAARNNMKTLISTLLKDPRVDPTASENSAFQAACQFGDLELVKLFLEDGRIDPAANNNQALINVSYAGKEDIVSLLLKQNNACNAEDCKGDQCKKICSRARGRLAQTTALLEGHLEIFDLLTACRTFHV